MSTADKLAAVAASKQSLKTALSLRNDVKFKDYYKYVMRWQPSELFKSGEQGAWYDPSDLNTLFQDAEGTTPVTASGQPVGLMKDKSGNGINAIQAVAGSRPLYRRGDGRGVVNLLKWSEDFSNAVWAKVSVALSGSQSSPPTQAESCYLLQEGTANGEHYAQRAYDNTAGFYVYSLYINTDGQTRSVYIMLVSVGNSPATSVARFESSNGVITPAYSSSGRLYSIESVDVGGGWYRVILKANILSGVTLHAVRLYSKSVTVYVGDGVSGYLVSGVQIEKGTEIAPYQRNDAHLGGVATGQPTDLHWLEYDRVDDKLIATMPAMPSATVARATADGVTLTHPNNIAAGAYTLEHVGSQGFDYGRVIVDRALTQDEQDRTTAYLGSKR